MQRGFSSVPNAIHAAVLLVRHPLLQKPVGEFEMHYHRYREEQTQNEARPFLEQFYYKKGTVAHDRFKAVQQSIDETLQPAEKDLLELKINTETKTALNELDRMPYSNIYMFEKKDGMVRLPSTNLEHSELLHKVQTR